MTKMKATLEFDLPDEDIEFDLAVNAGNWHAVVADIDEFLRGKIKHGDEGEKETEVYSKVREFLYQAVEDCGVTLNS